MAEYKSRRERRHAQGGKIGAAKPAGIALIIGVPKKPKKKDGGCVEGGMARAHLGKRARGGSTGEPRKTKQLDAREAALSSDGVDKVAVGSHREEREVPIEKRADGDAATNRVDDYYLRTNSGKVLPKQQYLARPSKFGADEDYERARGGRAEGGAAKYQTDDSSSKDMGDLGPSRGKAPQYENDEPRDKRASGGRIAATARREEHGSNDTREKRASGGWISAARDKIESKGTVGSLHRALHVSEGERIPSKRLEEARKDAGPALRKKIQFAENVRK